MSSSAIVGSLATRIPSPARSVPSPEEQCDTTPMEPPKAEPALEVFDLKLLTIIKPSSDICITCPCSIRIEILKGQYCYCYACTTENPALPHCNISASTPIRLFAETWTRISPTEPLNEAFAKGWQKIPDNLKYKILQVNLKADMLIGSDSRLSPVRLSQKNRFLGDLIAFTLAYVLDFCMDKLPGVISKARTPRPNPPQRQSTKRSRQRQHDRYYKHGCDHIPDTDDSAGRCGGQTGM